MLLRFLRSWSRCLRHAANLIVVLRRRLPGVHSTMAKPKYVAARWIRTAAARVLPRVGQIPVETTSPQQLISFLERLHPLTTELPLIRLGPADDGGYLVPDDLADIVACFSPGVSDTSGFESDCARRGIDVFMADASVQGPAETHDRFHFVRKYLGGVADDDTMTINTWVDESLQGRAGDLILQMDIEGAEYTVLSSASEELLLRMRIIIVEFHHLDALFSQRTFALMAPCFEKLLATHACVHIHPNNCCGTVTVRDIELPRIAEFTFLRRDRLGTGSYATQFPHPLDGDNTVKPHLPLPSSLFGGPRVR